MSAKPIAWPKPWSVATALVAFMSRVLSDYSAGAPVAVPRADERATPAKRKKRKKACKCRLRAAAVAYRSLHPR